MKKILYFCLAFVLFTKSYAQQVTITPDGITPKNTYPRISYEAILALPDPQEGDLAFDTTYKCLRIYIEGKWLCSYQDPNAYISSIAPIISAGGTGADMGQDIAIDNSGNIYITGSYTGTTQFGAINKTSVGSTDIFIAKYNSSGVVQWVKSAGGVNGEAATSIAVDASGNVYVTGSHGGDATFESTTISTYGGTDIFVVKYNTSGDFQWVKAAGGEQNDVSQSITVDNSGAIYLTGSYIDYAHFGATIINAEGESDIFIAKMDNAGTFQWIQTAGGENKDQGKGIVADNTGIYLTGDFEGTATFSTFSKTATGLSDMFIAKYNTSGVCQWVKSAGGGADDHGGGLAIDGSGNVYITGQFYGTATFEATTIGTSIANTYEVFLAKYNNSGTFQWAQAAGGTGFDYGSGVAVFGSNVYLTEYHFDFMPRGIINQLSADLSNKILSDETVWSDTVILKHEGSSAQIVEETHKKKIMIKAKGHDARGLMVLIMNSISNIIDEYRGVVPLIRVPCNCNMCQSLEKPSIFEYEKLMAWITNGRDTLTCNESDTKLSIFQLLYSIGLDKFEIISKIHSQDDLIVDVPSPIPTKIFVTYSWTDKDSNIDEAHHTKVHQLVNALNDRGFETTFDKEINDHEASTNFTKMMVQNIEKNDKVIIVLSEGYVVKANDFKSSVGFEYSLILNDIDVNTNKYLLVTFSDRTKDIYPFALRNRDTIDLSKNDPKEIDRLLRKLEGSPFVNMQPKGKRVALEKLKDVGKLF